MAKAPTEIKSLARSHTETALKVLARIMEQDSAPPAARVAAAQALLDRGWGKPSQSIEMTTEIIKKVVRAPEVQPAAKEWAEKHVPTAH